MNSLAVINIALPQILMLIIWLMVMCYPLIGVACILEITRSHKEPNDKTLWALIIILLPVIGFLSYLIAGRNNKQSFKI